MATIRGVSTTIRLGFPSADGGFNGLAVDVTVSPLVVLIGGAIAVSIVWLALRTERPAPADAVEPPANLAVARRA